MAAVLELNRVTKIFDRGLFQSRVRALAAVDLEVGAGEVFGLLGPNGAGKTTTIKIITGIVRLTSGRVRICGLPHDDPRARRRIGFMPEMPYFYRHLTGVEFLRLCADLLGMSAESREPRIREIVETVGMADRADGMMRSFSKGMLQRLSLAQALLGSPDLLILDEPMSGLDPLGRRDVRDIILAERDRGTTVFFSSHVIPDVETLCDRVALMVSGTVRIVGTVRDLMVQDQETSEATFSGLAIDDLTTPVVAGREASDGSWVRVASEHRDDLVAELADRGARLISLAPVRRSLEDFLVRHVEEDT